MIDKQTTPTNPAPTVCGTITREQALQIGLAALADIAAMRGAFGVDTSEDCAWAAKTAGDAVSVQAREIDILLEGLERVRSAVSRSLDPHIWHIADGALRRALGGEKA